MTETARTLVLIRHAKSDWSVAADDRSRPLAPRGRRQAPPSGRWIEEHVAPLDLALVSPARRARETWALVAAELTAQPQVEVSETAYTFDGDDLLGLVRSIDSRVRVAALVGHNPGLEELAEMLVGQWISMPTSSLAVIDLPGWGAQPGTGALRWSGRPADG